MMYARTSLPVTSKSLVCIWSPVSLCEPAAGLLREATKVSVPLPDFPHPSLLLSFPAKGSAGPSLPGHGTEVNSEIFEWDRPLRPFQEVTFQKSVTNVLY